MIHQAAGILTHEQHIMNLKTKVWKRSRCYPAGYKDEVLLCSVQSDVLRTCGVDPSAVPLSSTSCPSTEYQEIREPSSVQLHGCCNCCLPIWADLSTPQAGIDL